MKSACLSVIFIYFLVNRFYEVVAIRAVKGSTVQLECPYKDTGAGTLDWSFKSTTSSTFVAYTLNELTHPTIPSEVSTRLTVTGNHAIGQYHLSISNIRESDQGTYKCFDGASGNQQDQTLVIIEQYHGITYETSMRLTVNGNLDIGEYHLSISKIRENDRGTYACIDGASGNIHTDALIVIVGPTTVSLDNVTPDNKIPGTEGRQMTIKCTAEGGQPDPDVELIVLGLTHNGKNSAQQILTPVAGDDGSNVTCKAGYKDIEFFPLNTSAYIHLNLIPSIFPFGFDTLDTGETKSIDVSCKSTGSRPAASIYWLLGKDRFNVTSNSTSQPIHDSSKDMYTVTSSLEYRVARRYNGQKLICRAFNNAGSKETFLTLNVTYAPGVTVENTTFSLPQSPRQIHSTVDSNPPVNTCTWQHKSKYGEHIRDFINNNQTLTLPTVTADQRYQDTGEYVCTTENGIEGMNGQMKQIGSGYVISNAPPVITADNKDNFTQYGKFGKSTKIYVNVYSIPKYSKLSWYIDNTQLASNKYVFKEEPDIVKDVFHGVEVQVDGYRTTLTISDLQETDFTNYTLRLYYSTGSQYVQHEVTLESATQPVITSDNNSTQYGKFSKSTELKVNVYSIPKYSRISWYIGNTQLVSNKYVIKEEPAIVKDVFYGVKVQLDGYRVALAIRDLHVADFTNYTLSLYYSRGQYMQHDVTLESASAPETPSNFTITSVSETSITVQWIPGYDGGQKQIFYVQYRTSETNTWMLQEIQTINQIDIHNFYTVSGLQEKTTYQLRIYAQNAFNQSQKTDTATTTTLQLEAQTSSKALIGAVAGVVVVLLIVVAIPISILIIKKRKGIKQTEKNAGFYENSGFQNAQVGDVYDEVVSKSDTQQKQTSKTYESLGTKDAVDVYDDLDNRKGLTSSEPPVNLYEALSAKHKPNFYEELENRQGHTEKVYVNETF